MKTDQTEERGQSDEDQFWMMNKRKEAELADRSQTIEGRDELKTSEMFCVVGGESEVEKRRSKASEKMMKKKTSIEFHLLSSFHAFNARVNLRPKKTEEETSKSGLN